MHNFDGFGLLGTTGIIWIIIDWVIRIGALFVVPRNRKPTAGMAWLLVIFIVPIFGLLVFLILGNPKLPKSRRDAQKLLDDVIKNTLAAFRSTRDENPFLDVTVQDKRKALAKLSESLSHLPVLGGNKIEVLPEYNNVIERIAADIDAAQKYVEMEYFIIVLDEITEPVFAALGRATKRGVTARVMYDSLSTKRYKNWKETIKRLEDDGVRVQALLPLRLPGKGYVRPDLRNHRKLVVVDGLIGYTGSLNLVRRDYHRKDDIYYDEMVVRVHGPAALELATVFLTDWYCETGELPNDDSLHLNDATPSGFGDSLVQILPSGPGYEDENNLKLFTSLIHSAEKQITITNPYFVPDDALTTAITSAARRGVKVTMINSEAMDQWMVGHAQRSFYETLLKAGVHIHLYKAPILLHSKFITVDDDIATVGSSNLDIRSFLLNLEVTLITYDPAVVADLRAVEKQYLARTTRVTLKEWQERPTKKVLLDNIARLTSALQ